MDNVLSIMNCHPYSFYYVFCWPLCFYPVFILLKLVIYKKNKWVVVIHLQRGLGAWILCSASRVYIFKLYHLTVTIHVQATVWARWLFLISYCSKPARDQRWFPSKEQLSGHLWIANPLFVWRGLKR